MDGETMNTSFASNPIFVLPLGMVISDPNQPRKDFDEAALRSLADSLLSEGQLQPIIVRRVGDIYMIVAGERRWRACQLAKFENINAEIRDDLDVATISIIQIVENLQRQDLSLRETIAGCAELVQLVGLDKAASRLGMSKPWVSQRATIVKCSDEVRKLVDDGLIQDVEIAHIADKITAIDADAGAEFINDIRDPGWNPAITREDARDHLKDLQASKRRQKEQDDEAARVKAIKEREALASKARNGKLPIGEQPAIPPPPKNESAHDRERRVRAEAWAVMEPQLRASGRNSRKAILNALKQIVGEEPQQNFGLSAGLKDHFISYDCPDHAKSGDLKIELYGTAEDAGLVMDAIAPNHRIGLTIHPTIAQFRQIEAVMQQNEDFRSFNFREYPIVKASVFAAAEAKMREIHIQRKCAKALDGPSSKTGKSTGRNAGIDNTTPIGGLFKFIDECTSPAIPETRCPAADIDLAYTGWCKTNKREEVGTAVLSAVLIGLGYPRGRTEAAKYYSGLQLVTKKQKKS